MSEKRSGENGSPVLRCRELSKFVGQTMILDSIDLEVHPGELVIVSGPSGAGKTSLLRLIAGLERPSAGTIEIEGRKASSPCRVLDPKERGVGMVFEHAALWPHLTVEQHLGLVLKAGRLAKAERRRRLENLVESLHLSSFRHRFPHEISGGERQRVALARSLASSPCLLLLDEPLAHLDVHLAVHLADELIRIHRERELAMICVMHRPEDVNSEADRYVILEKGKIRQVGTETEVFGNPGSEFVQALARTLGYDSV